MSSTYIPMLLVIAIMAFLSSSQSNADVSTRTVLFFKNGTEIANLVRQNLKGMTNGTEEKNEKTVYT
jgi:hypothetical protein